MPRSDADDGEGWVLSLVTDTARDATELLVFDAARFGAGPVWTATVGGVALERPHDVPSLGVSAVPCPPVACVISVCRYSSSKSWGRRLAATPPPHPDSWVEGPSPCATSSSWA